MPHKQAIALAGAERFARYTALEQAFSGGPAKKIPAGTTGGWGGKGWFKSGQAAKTALGSTSS